MHTPSWFGLVLVCGGLSVAVGCGQQDPGDGTGGTSGVSGFVPDGTGGVGGAAGMAGAAGTAGAGGAPDVTTGGAGGTTPDVPVVAEDYYPAVDGAVWVYRHTGGSSDWDETVNMTTGTYQGASAFLTTDTAGPSGTHTDSVWIREGTRVLRTHKEVSTGAQLDAVADYVPGFVRFDSAWLDAAGGFTETLGYDRTEYDGQGVVTRMGPREHTFTIESLDEQVSVPAGTFSGCLRVLRSRVRSAGTAAVEGDEKRFWFCAGVGKTRELDLIVGKEEQLASCQIPGGRCP